MNASRFGGAPAGVAANAVAAGFIASSSGSAIVAPTPLSTIRREMCFRDKYIVISVTGDLKVGLYNLLPTTDKLVRRRHGWWHPPHSELLAANDALDQR
jgi:hypothetical protein